MLYAGEWRDSVTGLDYLRNRWYNPATGLFNIMDDFSSDNYDPPSLHKYLYAHANPIMNIDPLGQMTLVDVLSTITIVSTLTSMVLPAVGCGIAAVKAGVMPWEYIGELASLTTWREALVAAGMGAAGAGVINLIARNLGTKLLCVAGSVLSVYGLIKSIGLTQSMISGQVTRQDVAHYLAFTTAVVILSALVGKALSKPSAPPKQAGIYEFKGKTGKVYVGQSENIFRRIQQHLRSGKLRPEDIKTLKWKTMGGSSRIEREIAEQLKIDALGGVRKLENVINAIGKNRQHLLLQ